jgi:hypothetical protein
MRFGVHQTKQKRQWFSTGVFVCFLQPGTSLVRFLMKGGSMDNTFTQSLIRQTGTASATEAMRVLLVLAGLKPNR